MPNIILSQKSKENLFPSLVIRFYSFPHIVSSIVRPAKKRFSHSTDPVSAPSPSASETNQLLLFPNGRGSSGFPPSEGYFRRTVVIPYLKENDKDWLPHYKSITIIPTPPHNNKANKMSRQRPLFPFLLNSTEPSSGWSEAEREN